MNQKPWIGVDLDGTLAKYDRWRGMEHIGEPIRPMVDRVKRWIRAGKTVKIFTARASKGNMARRIVREWCKEHLGKELEVTNEKDFAMIELWDDRAIRVRENEGMPYEEDWPPGRD